PEKQFYHCFGCGASGNIIKFIMAYDGRDFVEAIEELANKLGLSVVYDEPTTSFTPPPQQESLYPLMEQVARYYRQQLRQPIAQTAVAYLKGRGVSGEIARDFGLGYAPPGWNNLLDTFGSSTLQRLLEAGLIIRHHSGQYYDRFRHQILFPIHDSRGRVVGFGARVLDDSKPKYLNSPETPLFHKENELYGWHLARRVRSLESVIIVEGYMDVLALVQHSIINVVATLGTTLSERHLQQLFRRVSEIVICFDADEAGEKAAWRALKTILPWLQGERQVKFAFLPSGEDPDSFVRKVGPATFLQKLNEAKTLSDYLLEQLRQRADLRSIEGRVKLLAQAVPPLALLPEDSHYFSLIVSTISEQSGITKEELIEQVRKQHHSVKTNHPLVEKPLQDEKHLVLKTIQLLLHLPDLAHTVENVAQLSVLEEKGINLLIELLEFIKNHPKKLNTAMICQYWQGKATESYVLQLATKEVSLEPTAIAREFTGLINQLYADAMDKVLRDKQQQRFEFLKRKGMIHLTATEKQELLELTNSITH
ncbi:MAG: DNA primase, partial [Beggiatoa sp. IS2]